MAVRIVRLYLDGAPTANFGVFVLASVEERRREIIDRCDVSRLDFEQFPENRNGLRVSALCHQFVGSGQNLTGIAQRSLVRGAISGSSPVRGPFTERCTMSC